MAADIMVSNGRALIFNAQDACRFRRDHRIVGSLVGCLPRAPRQNIQRGLPLQLLNEEAELLREKGLARLVENVYNVAPEDPSRKQLVEQFNKMRDDQYWEQNDLYKEDRRRKIKEMADTIVEGKRKKLKKLAPDGPELDRDELLQMELSKIDTLIIPRDSATVQLFTECPWKNTYQVQPAIWNFPRTDDERLRYAVFKDLWNKGYFITSGGKFGGDFLVYPGDPIRYHAAHIAICVGASEKMTSHDIIAKGRLGTIVKKNVLLCSLSVGSETVTYLSLRWYKQS